MNEFITYLESRIEEDKAEIVKLNAEDRRDDADFARVRTNIYEVCKSVSQTLLNRPGDGKAAVRAQFERFRTGWGAALEKAKQHDDIGGIAVEEIKLAALADITARFEEVTGA